MVVIFVHTLLQFNQISDMKCGSSESMDLHVSGLQHRFVYQSNVCDRLHVSNTYLPQETISPHLCAVLLAGVHGILKMYDIFQNRTRRFERHDNYG